MTLLWLALGTLVSEDLACVSAGLLVANGTFSFFPVVLAVFLGIYVGDLLLFFAGRHIGRPALRSAPFKWFMREDDLERSSAWFRRRGTAVILLSRLVPGTRLPTYIAAGILHVDLGQFAAYTFIAGLLWTPLLVGAAAAVGAGAFMLFGVYRKYALGVALVLLIVIWVIAELLIPLCTFRGRRLLLSLCRRLTRWEFWPLWAFYPPIILYIAWLALKHRSLALFTAANPAIPAGGFVGESKVDILGELRQSPGFVARYAAVRSTEDVHAFMRRENLAFPVVLKPDVGQRGLGVAVITTDDKLATYFRKPRPPTIAQEYIAGHEFGVFYYRFPNETRGHILSITEKRFPSVTGDGVRTLEELILNDDRAVCMARYFLRKHAERLDSVPPGGEMVPLAELGTHCRGSLFMDGNRLKTPEMEETIDQISRGFPGFYFGRYDIRATSIEDFRRGRNFKILELNGVTSEATHIYHPGSSLLVAYRTLMEQWRICFEIAAQNRARGMAPVRARHLISLLTRYVPAPEAN